MAKVEGGIRQKRKPRGRGIRATTGCLICKRRHVKCDEAHPQCGPCAKGQRPCVYAPQYSVHRSDVAGQPGMFESSLEKVSGDQNDGSNPSTSSPQALVDSCHQDQQPIRQGSPHVEAQQALTASTCENVVIPTPKSSDSYVLSPDTESSVTARVAPSIWFECLAKASTDGDGGFPLSLSELSRNRTENGEDRRNISNLHSRTLREQETFHIAALQRDKDIEQGIVPQPSDTASVAINAPSLWTSKDPIPLSDLEHYLFRHFVRVSSKLLDFYDPEMHFATTVPHIALRNAGLMKALLALSARHITLGESEKEHLVRVSVDKDDISGRREDIVDRNLAVEYYLEALYYLNKARQYPFYARSLDMIATVVLISTYEMINGSNQNWKRHIKGVFWIQKLQENNGESGGLRSAVWWAWLQQDIWIAMRERRRVFSLWNPRKPVSSLTASELATRAIYLLSQCINYASKEEEEKVTNLAHRLDWANKLLSLLQEWREILPPEYSPLPSVSNIEIFPPIWVNSPPYAAALQIHSLALILVILHRPSGGIDDYRAAQHMLAVSVSTICGIARCVDENDYGANMTSLNCLSGAGLCVHTPYERLALLDLLDSCQRRVCWPRVSLRKELELEYSKEAFKGLMR